MKILFIGDVFAKPGREAVKSFLPGMRREMGIDFVIANIENMTHGKGFHPDQVAEMTSVGVDFCTSGNHAWGDRNGVLKLSDPDFPVIRPANYPTACPGRGYTILNCGDFKIGIINLMGRVFMKDDLNCPFLAFDEIYKVFEEQKVRVVFVDLHAETTSEKVAFGHYVNGRASVVVGTHTHVQTNDAQILSGGTAYLTDAGFTGDRDSVIGMRKEGVIQQFLTQMPQKHEPAEGKGMMNGMIVEIDEATGKAKNIKTFSVI
ncbi:MAG: TIGR00282 family metallophosphoesterase [Patescibacteria group bacterium]